MGWGGNEGVAMAVQDHISLCITTMHIRRNAELRENKYFKLTALMPQRTIAVFWSAIWYDTVYILRYFCEQVDKHKHECKRAARLFLLYIFIRNEVQFVCYFKYRQK
jgi:hypothetical protein